MALDARLAAALQENDDIRQERDSQAHRAKLAEARLVAFEDRAGELAPDLNKAVRLPYMSCRQTSDRSSSPAGKSRIETSSATRIIGITPAGCPYPFERAAEQRKFYAFASSYRRNIYDFSIFESRQLKKILRFQERWNP